MTEGSGTVNAIVMELHLAYPFDMKRLFAYALALATLAACAPVQTFYKTGAPVARLNSDTTTCRVDALKQVPVEKARVQGPPRYIPARSYCNAKGHCYYEPAEWEPGPVVVVDLNAELRADVTEQCMARRGYARVEIPACPPGSGPVAAQTTLPPLTPQSCAVRTNDGGFVVLRTP